MIIFICGYYRLFFAYTVLTFNLPAARMCDFTIRCKGCGGSVPALVETVPASWIVIACPLCGEKRRYLPPDVFRGRLSASIGRKPVRSETFPWGR